MNIITRSGAAVAMAVMAATAAHAISKPITLAFKLPKKFPDVSPTVAAALTADPLWLDLADGRDSSDPAVVGAQTERGVELYLWRAQQPVAPAVSGFVQQILTGWSMRIAPGDGPGLALKLTHYWVREKSETFGSSYDAEVRFTAALVDGTGTILWTREAAGTAKRTGVDARASICNELLSLALRDAVAQVVAPTPANASAPVAAASAAVAESSAAAPPTVVDPDALLADLLRLKSGGVADDVLVAYVKQRKLSRPLTVDEILAWKNAGIPDAAIKAAVGA